MQFGSMNCHQHKTGQAVCSDAIQIANARMKGSHSVKRHRITIVSISFLPEVTHFLYFDVFNMRHSRRQRLSSQGEDNEVIQLNSIAKVSIGLFKCLSSY